MQERLALYLERFAHFFRRDFFVQRCFEKLNSEDKPSHAGFRRACATLYAVYREEQLVGRASVSASACSAPEDFSEFCYKDDMFTEFCVRNVEDFFPAAARSRPSGSS